MHQRSMDSTTLPQTARPRYTWYAFPVNTPGRWLDHTELKSWFPVQSVAERRLEMVAKPVLRPAAISATVLFAARQLQEEGVAAPHTRRRKMFCLYRSSTAYHRRRS